MHTENEGIFKGRGEYSGILLKKGLKQETTRGDVQQASAAGVHLRSLPQEKWGWTV